MKSTAKGEVPRGVPGGAPPLPAAVPLTAAGEDEPDVHHTSAMFCTLAPPTAAAAAAAVTAQRAIPRARAGSAAAGVAHQTTETRARGAKHRRQTKPMPSHAVLCGPAAKLSAQVAHSNLYTLRAH